MLTDDSDEDVVAQFSSDESASDVDEPTAKRAAPARARRAVAGGPKQYAFSDRESNDSDAVVISESGSESESDEDFAGSKPTKKRALPVKATDKQPPATKAEAPQGITNRDKAGQTDGGRNEGKEKVVKEKVVSVPATAKPTTKKQTATTESESSSHHGKKRTLQPSRSQPKQAKVSDVPVVYMPL